MNKSIIIGFVILTFGVQLLFAQQAAQPASVSSKAPKKTSGPKAALNRQGTKINLSQEMIRRMMRNRPTGQSFSADEQAANIDNPLPAGFHPRDFARAGINQPFKPMRKQMPYRPNAAERQFFKTLQQNNMANPDILPAWMRSAGSNADSSVAAPAPPMLRISSKQQLQQTAQQPTQNPALQPSQAVPAAPPAGLNPMYQKAFEQHLQNRQSQTTYTRQPPQNSK